jgi:iron complex outermembrane recepter protein
MSRSIDVARSIRLTLTVSAAATLSSLAATAYAQEQAASSASDQTLQTVVVTGSLIKRTDFETPSPVQVISSQDLQQSGYTSVQQVLSNLAANGQGTLSQGFSGAFAAGASGIALRGLTVGATLTLIDGQRMVAYPLTDDGQRSFVDTSSIPLVAVDRIDVLKDGASAEYGSDAMAGVVNVILKKSFTGAEVSADAGTTSHHDGSTERLSGIFGTGDLAADGYNAYLAVEWRHQDEIWNYNRTGEPWNQLDWTPQGGTNSTPGAGSLWANYGAFSSFPSASGYYLVPGSATSFQSPGVIFPTSACPSATALANDQCTFTEKGFQIQPQTGNLNIIGRYTKTLSATWQAVVTASMFHSEAEQSGAYQSMDPAGPGQPIQFPAYGPGYLTVTNPVTLTVPVGNKMNPTNQPLYPVGNLYEFGNSVDEIATTTDRVFLDFKGTELGWDIDANFGWMYARTDQTLLGLVNYQGLQTALDNGYVFGTGGPATAGISVPVNNQMSNTLQVIDIGGTRDLFTLPGGPLSLGLGVGFNHRYLNAVPSTLAQSGDYQIINGAYAYGGQTDYSAYGEIVAPIIKGLEVDIAERYDHYNNVGGADVPKFGVKYTPIKYITLRGTYGKGFRAPNPAEYSHAASAFLLGEYADSLLCPSSNSNPYYPPYNLNYPVTPVAGDVAAFCNFPATFVQGTNPALLPERSTNYTFGAILQPVEQLSISVDFWDIKVTNLIVSPSEFPALPFPPQAVLNARTGPVTLPVCTNSPVSGSCTTELETFAEGQPIYSLTSYENAGEIHVNGLDVDLDTHFDIGRFGRISGSLNYSHEFLWDMSSCYAGQCATVYLAGTHGPTGISGDTGNPKDRAVLTLSWDKGPWDMTWTINYTGHYSLTDPSTGINDCADAIAASFNAAAKFANGVFPAQYCTVSHFTDVNLYLSYAFSNHLSVTGSVVNLFNAQPPVDLQTYGNSILSYNPSLAQDGAVGTFFNLGVKYKF